MENQTISRKALKEIHDIACADWKTKLEGYAKRNPFQDDIQLSQSEVDAMFNASDAAQKKVLRKYFSRPLSIMDKIKSFEDACVHLGIKAESLFSNLDDKSDIAFKKLKVIIKALNEGWYPDWENENEYKYWNYFKMKGGFSFWSTNTYDARTFVPSALCLKNAELAQYVVEIALKEYEDYYK